MKPRVNLISLLNLSVIFSIVAIVGCNNPRPEKPNVVLILADDLGWQDVKCYDIDEPCLFETPNIDNLAEEGVKFWQAYSPTPVCSPSRGAILAGKHAARLQRTFVLGGSPPMPYHEERLSTIPPWYSGRLPVTETTIAEVLQTNGYITGHSGKWHIAIDHHAFPQPEDHGFDITTADRGVANRMTPDRLSDFSTTESDDPYRLDENGFPRDPNNENALAFLKQAKDKPFFLYYATWLVHAPIQMRSKQLLEKYCEKLNVPYPIDPEGWDIEGQKNPYYAAMVEMFDYYIGQVINYLRTTDDPRWKGHKLIENTYIIFTSDNGGMEGHTGEIYTDNYPLDKGKINAKEGGIRVPLIIAGPGIESGQESDVMLNGIDFFPTILSWTGSEFDERQELDGIDLSTLLATDPDDKNLLVGKTGRVRNTMIHHFPQASMQSTIRIGDYKFIHNYDPFKKSELYRLYQDGKKRVDIEEMNDLSERMQEKAAEMSEILFDSLKSMQAGMPFLNPYCIHEIPHKEGICEVTGHGKEGNTVWLKYSENDNKVTGASLIYTDNGGQQYEEWYKADAVVEKGKLVRARLPKGTTHYIFNLVDEYNFMVSYPRMGDINDYRGGKYSVNALNVSNNNNN